jgi:hypothetical protein
LISASPPSYRSFRLPRRASSRTCGQTASASPVTTESAHATASSRHMVAWMPPIMTGTPRRRKKSANRIGTVRLRGEGGNSNQVGLRHRRMVGRAEILVHDGNLLLRCSQTCENHKAERLPHPITVPSAFPDFDNADKWIGWIDQISSHSIYSLTDRDSLSPFPS